MKSNLQFSQFRVQSMRVLRTRGSQLSAIITISLFSALIFLPGLLGLTGILSGFQPQFERREATLFPKWVDFQDSKKAFDALESYIADHIAFRSIFVRLHSTVQQRVFGVSPNKRVIFGNNGFLYTAGINLDMHLGKTQLSQAQLAQWRETLSLREQMLQTQKITYRFLAAPTKLDIYPENLPKKYKLRAAETVIDQFYGCLGDSTPVVVDVRGSLLSGKSLKDPLFFRTDVHWNQLGSFIALSAVIDSIAAANNLVPRLHLSDTQSGYEIFHDGSEAVETGYPEWYMEKQLKVWLNKEFQNYTIREIPKPEWIARSYRVMEALSDKPVNRQLVVLIHDSFGDQFINFLQRSFMRTITIGTRVILNNCEIQEIVNHWRPDVLIEEISSDKLTTIR